MRHFAAYHNAKKMGYSCIAIPSPRVKTSKSVANLEGVTVWLIAEEGERPKRYYLASKFVAKMCEMNLYPRTELRNQISGDGKLLGISIPLDGTALLDTLRNRSANFVNGFYELKDATAIRALEILVP